MTLSNPLYGIADIPILFLNTGIETFHKTLDVGSAGDQMGVLLKGLKRDDVRRGMFACKPGSRSQHDQFTAQFYIMKKEEGGTDLPVVGGKQMLVYSGTWDTAAFFMM